MPIQSQEQLDAFKDVAIQQGYDPAEIESFMSMATAANKQKQFAADETKSDELTMYEDKLKLQQQYSTSSGSQPGSLSEIQQKAISGGQADVVYDEASGSYKVVPRSAEQADPLKWAANNQAFGYLTGKTKDERTAQAASMQSLGIEGYLQVSALPDLLTAKEMEARDKATAILNSTSSIITSLQGANGRAKNVQGVGILGRFRPSWMTNPEGTSVKQNIVNITADRMKEISGAAISDKEVQRLSKALPQVGDTEANIVTKSKNIADAIEIGMQMQEAAKRERLTLDEAYKKHGEAAFQAKGQPVPAWIKGTDKPGLNLGAGSTNSNDDTKIGRFTVQVE